MKKIITALLLPFIIVSCDHIGSSRVKNLIDLTERLEVEAASPLKFEDEEKTIDTHAKTKAYKLAKNKIIAKPAIAGGVIYSVDNKGYVSAFSLELQKILWSTDIAKNVLDRSFNSGGILFSDGKLYITNSSKYLFILDAKSGHELVRKEFSDVLRAKPIMATDRLLLLQTISNQLIAYDVESSKVMWIHEGAIETITTSHQIDPVIYNGHALVSFSSGQVLFINVNTGQEKWVYSLTNLSDVGLPSFEPSVIVTAPMIQKNYAYFATSNGKIIKIDLDNGTPAWLKKVDDVQSMKLIGSNLLITNNARQIAALSTHNGTINWIGDLISAKDRGAKRPKTTLFQDPFVTKTKDGFAVNVIASNGELYEFNTDSFGNLSKEPKIIKIVNHVKYHWISCCNGKLHLINNNYVNF